MRARNASGRLVVVVVVVVFDERISQDGWGRKQVRARHEQAVIIAEYEEGVDEEVCILLLVYG